MNIGSTPQSQGFPALERPLSEAHTGASASRKLHTCPRLRVLAVAAPDRVAGRKDRSALDSVDPASLFNACRIAAERTSFNEGAWAESNWSGGRTEVRDKFSLLYSLDDMPAFIEKLEQQRPNLLLIGAMTLCMPGAIECARVARNLLGEDILIVLGGRHPTETVYLSSPRPRSAENVHHHRASPVLLMRQARIPPLFDFVVSGDGEYLIAELGEAVASSGPRNLDKIIRCLTPSIPGDWILSTIDPTLEMVSAGVPINRNALPPLAPLFGVSAAFDIFGGKMTAHVFSDTGRGCAYDCDFCSERSSIAGRLYDVASAPRRLYRQLAEAARIIEQDCPGRGASAFVEDSVLLGGSPKFIDQFCDLLEGNPIPIHFGAQLTIDLVIKREPQIARLARAGLTYLFIGLETFDPREIGGMSKDLESREKPWHVRFQAVLDILERHGIMCGCALLFGLGESHASRLALLEMLLAERRLRRAPAALSANWAVQHPLCGREGDPGYDYLDWGTPAGPMLELFHNFGEASTAYCIAGLSPPTPNEVTEIVGMLRQFRNLDNGRACSRPSRPQHFLLV